MLKVLKKHSLIQVSLGPPCEMGVLVSHFIDEDGKASRGNVASQAHTAGDPRLRPRLSLTLRGPPKGQRLLSTSQSQQLWRVTYRGEKKRPNRSPTAQKQASSFDEHHLVLSGSVHTPGRLRQTYRKEVTKTQQRSVFSVLNSAL